MTQSSVRKELDGERRERKESAERLGLKIDALEHTIMDGVLMRIGKIEGELKGMREILNSIQNWFINNTPAGGK